MADKNSWLLLGTIHYTTEPPPATLLPLLARQLRPGAEPIPRDEQEQGAHPGMEAGAPEQEFNSTHRDGVTRGTRHSPHSSAGHSGFQQAKCVTYLGSLLGTWGIL